MASNHVLRGVVAYSVAGLVGKSAPFLMLPVLTRYLTPEDYGLVATISAIYSLAMILVDSGSGNHIAAGFFSAPDRREQARLEAFLIAGLGAGPLLACASLVVIFDSGIHGFSNSWLLLVIGAAFFRSVLDHKLLVMNFRGDTWLFGISQVGITIVEALLSILFVVVFDWGWAGRVLAMLGISTVGGLLAILDLLPGWKNVSVLLPGLVHKWAKGWNIVVHGAANWMTVGLDRYLITLLDSKESAGMYAVSAQIVSSLAIVSGAFSQAWNRHVFSALATGVSRERKQIVMWTYWAALVWALVCVLFLIVAPRIAVFVVGDKFSGLDAFLPYLVGQAFFVGLYYLVCGYYFARDATGLLASFTLVSGCICLIADLVLIPSWGAMGAALGGLIASFVYFSMVWMGSMFVQPMPWLAWRRKS